MNGNMINRISALTKSFSAQKKKENDSNFPTTWQKSLALLVLVLVLLNTSSPATGAVLETFVLSGRIMDIEGIPIAGAEIFVYDSATIRRPADFISAPTGRDGRFGLTLPRQKAWVVARVRSGDKFGPLLPGDRHSGEPMILEPDDTGELRQDFTVVNILEAARQKQKVRSDYQRVSGRILDQYGKPVHNAYVFADHKKSVRRMPEYISAWSDDKGSYTMYLPPGRYYIGASTIFPAPEGSSANRELDVGTGNIAVAIDIKLPL